MLWPVKCFFTFFGSPTVLRYILLASLILVAALVGCGPSSVSVEGIASVDGTPLDTGNVAFHPVGTKGDVESVVGRSEIDSSGKYKLYTDGKPGVPAGSYKVVVLAGKPANSSDPYSTPVSLIDKKYTQLETTPLTVDVASGASPDKYKLSLTK